MGDHRTLIVADLFFGLSAILLIFVMFVAENQALRFVAAQTTSADPETLKSVTETFARENQTTVVLAGPIGIDVATPDETYAVALNQIPAWQPSDANLLVVVAPDGLEADFLLGAALYQAGIVQILRLRLAGLCPRIGTGPLGLPECLS